MEIKQKIEASALTSIGEADLFAGVQFVFYFLIVKLFFFFCLVLFYLLPPHNNSTVNDDSNGQLTTFYLRFSTIRRPLNDDVELLFYATLYERPTAASTTSGQCGEFLELQVLWELKSYQPLSRNVATVFRRGAGYMYCAVLQACALLLLLQTHLCVTCKIVAKTDSAKYHCALLVATVIAIHTNWYQLWRTYNKKQIK